MSLRKLKRSRSKQSRQQLVSKHGVSNPGELLRVAHQHLQAGKVKEAEEVFRRIIRAFPGNAAACNDLGALYHSQGKIDEAVSLYKKAIAIDKKYPQPLTNYGLVLLDQGDFDGAVDFFQRALEINPRDVGALTNFGLALHKQGKPDEATAAYHRVLAINPEDIYALNNLALVLKEQENFDGAADAYKKIIVISPNSDAYNALGLVYRKQGKFDKAVASFETALDVNSDQLDSWRNLGVVYTENMAFDQAIPVYEKVVEKTPEDYDMLTKLGILHQKRGNLDQAVRYFRRSLEVNPEFLAARSSLAETLEKYNKVDEAYDEALKGLEVVPDDIALSGIAAVCERRLGEFQKALIRLSKLDVGLADLTDQRRIYFEFGRLYDKKGEYEKAYSSFFAGNRAARSFKKNIDENYLLNRVNSLRRQFSSCGTLPGIDPSLNTSGPVFLVGFPRSGTTLLDQILDSHAKVQTMEEKDIIDSLEKKFVDSVDGYFAAWRGLKTEKIEDLQRDYYHEADKYLDRQPNSLLVDRLPMNITQAPLIWRIFPDAKFILAVRHPLDVCLSCFMQDFDLNTQNVNFFTLEDAATLYADVMGLWRLYIDKLPLNCHMVRYEDLVGDLESEARRIMSFLGLEWDEKALTFYEHAKAKGRIKTASYSQVTQAIYQHARYRWQRYEKYCGPLKEKLAPFIDYFGY